MADRTDPVWTELGNIDYLLDQLARGVERGDVPLATYEHLAPRYLERRAELAGVLERRVVREQAATGQGAPAPVHHAAPQAAAVAGYQQPPAATPALRPTPAPRQIEVNWAGVLTGVGALLVIVASAIFAIATWEIFSVGFKISFLALLTAGFYIAGMLVRTRLSLPGAGVALVAVGSAMLLFDGWIVIDGYGLSGPWPWVGWLVACSAVYWLTEVRLAGQFFGAVGAAAQIAWIWLLGQGLGWTTEPRMAAVAIVGLLWAITGRYGAENPALRSLARVLRVGAPLAVAGAAAALLFDLDLAPATATGVISAAVVALCASAVAETANLPRGLAALAYVPVFASILSAASGPGGVGATLIVTAALLAVVALVYELVRGGVGHGVVAFAAELVFWILLAWRFEWAVDVSMAVLGAVALSWLAAARIVESSGADEAAPGTEALRLTALIAGYTLLGAVTLALPGAAGVPLAATASTARDVALFAYLTLVWFAAARIRPEGGAGVAVIAGSFYTLAGLLGWLAPGWHSALYASALLSLVVALTVLQTPVARYLRLMPEFIGWWMRGLGLLIPLGGIAATLVFFDLQAWQVALMIALTSALWLTDALIAEENRWGLIVASLSAVLSIAVAAWWLGDTTREPETFSVAGAVAALLLASPALLRKASAGWRDAWPLGSALAASLCAAVSLAGDAGFSAVVLALGALVWAICAAKVLPELTLAAGAFALGAVYFALSALDGRPVWTILAILAVSAIALAPSFLLDPAQSSRRSRHTVSLALVSIAAPLSLIVVAGLDGSGWLAIGDQGLVVAWLALGVAAIGAGVAHRFEPVVYAGGACLVVAAWVELSALDISHVEPFALSLAAYVAWIGARISRRTAVKPPLVTDIVSTAIALVPAALAAVFTGLAEQAFTHILWAIGLALAAIALGIVMRVRSYFFGGSAALVFVALGRSWTFLVAFWWLVLGVIGVAMLIVAITWQRQQLLLAATQRRMADTFGAWR